MVVVEWLVAPDGILRGNLEMLASGRPKIFFLESHLKTLNFG